jgi:hypothetical protein
MLLPINLLIILYYCICANAKRTVPVVSIIEVIAIIVIIVYDILVITLVPCDYHVPVSQESYEEPRDEPSGTRTPQTPAVSPSHEPPPSAPPGIRCS